MPIKALNDYYDLLDSEGMILPEGYSKVNINYLICLTEEGKIDRLIKYEERQEIRDVKGKVKEKWVPRVVQMPQRTQKTGIDSNFIEHRPLYIFGLNYQEGQLTTEDRTSKARKSHQAFVEKNLEFLEGVDSPVVNAYRNFLNGWRPEEETENVELRGLKKEYDKSGYAFCLTGYPDRLLQDEEAVKQRWEQRLRKSSEDGAQSIMAQCGVSGKEAPIARIHGKIRGVYGGHTTGSVLIGYNNPSESSYGREQSYNSNISEGVMKKYTEALNYLLQNTSESNSRKHKMVLDDVTVVFWAMKAGGTCEDMFMAMLYEQPSRMDKNATENMLREMLRSGGKGKMTAERLESLDMIDPDVDFYMLGLKPNSSRLSVKFFYRRKYADILWNLAMFQGDLQVTEELEPISISQIKRELISPRSSSENVNPALLTKLFEAALYNIHYPASLLGTMVKRVKTDSDKKINQIRAGVIKACLNRNYKKEEFSVALDKENYEQAYLCGRLFAVLEKLQQDASKNSLNRTIKDAYFASASSKPVMIFPKLVRLAQNHLGKIEKPMLIFYSKLIGEIMDKLDGEFPETLLLQDQGRFIIGYYQQMQSFFAKNSNAENNQQISEQDVDQLSDVQTGYEKL